MIGNGGGLGGSDDRAASKSGQRLQLIALASRRIRSALAFCERHSEEGEHRELPRMTLRQPWE